MPRKTASRRLSTAPATKADLHALERRMEKSFDGKLQRIRTDITGTKNDITQSLDGKLERMKDDITQSFDGKLRHLKDEIVHEFKVVAENIHRDVAGAQSDRIGLLEDTKARHEERITALERHTGLPTT